MSGRPCGCGQWAFRGSYQWQVADPRPLRLPVLALGQPGLWELAPAVAAAVARMAGMPETSGMPGGARWPGATVGASSEPSWHRRAGLAAVSRAYHRRAVHAP